MNEQNVSLSKGLFFLVLLSFLTFAQEWNEALIIQGKIFIVSYNELYQQPNWIFYCVRDVPKNVDRKGYNFWKDVQVWNSNNADYKNNIWDKGHFTPAAAFSDSKVNLKATFSFLNFTLQHQRLNRKEWAQLKHQVRDWAKAFDDMSLEIDILFEQTL